MNIAIITARAGSKSILNKNVYPIAGKPLIAYPIQAALDAEKISRIYISTDGASIADVGQKMGCEINWRPEELCGDDVNHGLVIKQAVEFADAREQDLENIVLLLGNTVMIDGGLIDQALAILDERKDLDSVMSVWEAADDHPYRALEVHEGLLRPFGESNRQVSTARQSYPKVYYYDQGVWAFRKECVQHRDGPNPWWWMGKRCYPIYRAWVTGRDIQATIDVELAEWWAQNSERLSKVKP